MGNGVHADGSIEHGRADARCGPGPRLPRPRTCLDALRCPDRDADGGRPHDRSRVRSETLLDEDDEEERNEEENGHRRAEYEHQEHGDCYHA